MEKMFQNSSFISRYALAIVLAAVASIGVNAQCTNNNTAIAGGAITPPCPGSTNVPCVNAGQYALVNVTAGNIYTFNTCGATYDTRITLFNNAGGVSIGFNDDFCGLQSQVTWTATFTGQLRVLVDRYQNVPNPCVHTGGCAPMAISCVLAPAPMTNNTCGSAIVLPVIENCFVQNFTNVGSTASGSLPVPTCSTAPNTDVWFRFVAPASGVVRIESTSITMVDGAMQVYSGACGALALVPAGCDDDSGPGLMPYLDRRCAALTPGATYFIRYWGYGGSTGAFTLCVRGPEFFPTPQEDCAGGQTVCGSQAINNSADYTGCSVDLNTTNRGCLLANERQGTWYYFSPQAAGTMGFTIQPTGAGGLPANVDYDFAVWGPQTAVSCPPPGAPIRCSWAYPPNVPGYPGNVAYQTGLAAGNVDLSEGAGPGGGVNGFVAPITVGAAQVGMIYTLYVDNFDITGQSFNLNWALSSSGMLDCTVLPVELINFNALAEHSNVVITWSTQTEANSDRFELEHSTDASHFSTIGTLTAAGHSQTLIDYLTIHKDPLDGINYYRLKQVDRDGSFTYTDVRAVEFKPKRTTLLPRPNPATSTLQIDLPEGLSGFFEFQVFDASGRTAMTATGSAPDVPAFSNLAIDALEDGWYVLTLKDESGELLGTGRFVKQ